MENQIALGIIDAQRGFMPALEGERLGVPGFGELPVTDGELIVPNLNNLTHAFRSHMAPIATTQDWHPEETAHFATEPNFVNTWPKHCRADTPGAELHPELYVAHINSLLPHFKKGMEAALTPDDDTSYTGVLAYDLKTKETFPQWLESHKVTTVVLGGLALGDGKENPLCVDSTAIDLRRIGYDVVVTTDAVEAVMPENRELCFKNLGEIGVKLMTTNQVLAEVAKVYGD